MANKRHAKPTAQQLADRSYRKILVLERKFRTLKIVLDHFGRVLREKEILQGQVETLEHQLRCRGVNQVIS